MEEDGTTAAAGEAGSRPASPCRSRHRTLEGVAVSSSPILDLSRRGLQHLGEVFKIPTLKQLHLQRNALRAVPEDFFQLLPRLTWLDLRHNRLEALPAGVGAHKHLRTLLLERNPIKALPAELGNVTTLKALSLRHCPLEFPPPLVLQQGLAAVLRFLRAAQCACPGGPASAATSPGNDATLGPLAGPARGFPGPCVPCGEATQLQEPEAALLEAPGDPFPPGESRDLRTAAGSWDDWPSEEEIRRFWKLRQEIVEKQQADTLAHQLLALQLPPNLRAVLHTRGQARPNAPRAPRRKPPSFGGALPSLASVRPVVTRARRLEESHTSALRALRETQVWLERRRRDRMVPREWRDHVPAARTWDREPGSVPPRWRTLVTSRLPFATDRVDKEDTSAATPSGKMRQSREKPSEELSASGAGALERLSRPVWHTRRTGFRGALPEDAREATQDLEVARELRDAAAKLKSGPAASSGHRLPALAGDLPPCPAAPRAQHQVLSPPRAAPRARDSTSRLPAGPVQPWASRGP